MTCVCSSVIRCAAVAVAAVLGDAAQAGMITLGAVQDATLYESQDGSLANGAGQYIFAGRNNQSPSGFVRRGLVQFDLSGVVPEGAKIVAARLVLNLSQLNGGSAEVSLHRSFSEWTAGASDPAGNEGSGASAGPGDATWIHSSFGGQEGSDSLWMAPGGDFSAAASASVITTGLGLYTWSSEALLADVRAFAANPLSNFGWFIIGPESSVGVTRRFDSADSALVGGIVPRLEIEWTVVPGPAGAVALVAGLAVAGRRRRRDRAQ
jgi:hypothetical protein